MSLPLDERTGTQQPQISHLPVDVHSLDVAEECIELAEAYGPPLDEAQKITLRSWMGIRRDGLWAARTVGHGCSRQNGKGDELQHREAWGLLLRGERIIHTSQELQTSVNAFMRLVGMFEAHDDLRRRVARIRYANGEQGIEMLNGGSIRYRARTGPGARGLDDIAVVVYDEAQHLQREHVAASSPVMAVNPNPQLILTGSAGLSFSEVWWEARLNALRQRGERFAYVEHTAEQCSVDDNGRFSSIRPNAADEAAWAAANPAYGSRISREFLAAQLQFMGDELFAREHLGVWDALPSMAMASGAKLPEVAWRDTEVAAPPQINTGELTMAFDVEVDNSFAAISIASGTLADAYVETIEHRPGVGWIPGRIVELVQRWNPTKVVTDAGSGAAVAILGEINEHFERNRLPAGVVQVMTSSQYRAACSAFLQAVMDGKVRRPIVDNDRLLQAGLTARERKVGDAFVFDRRNSPDPIVALTSAAMARAQLSEPSTEFAGGFHDLSDFLTD